MVKGTEYHRRMIRQAHPSFFRGASRALLALLTASGLTLALAPAQAQDSRAQKPAPKAAAKPDPKAKVDPKAKPDAKAKPAAAAKPDPKAAATKTAAAAAGGAAKPNLVASMGDWGVYATAGGKDRTCYALAQPKDRLPAALKRDPAYLFISTRPGENVRNEVSIIMGFDVKTDKTPAEAMVGSKKFAMAAQGSHLWTQEKDDGAVLVDTLLKGSRLVVKAASARGNQTTDSYSLSGLKAALDRVQKECP